MQRFRWLLFVVALAAPVLARAEYCPPGYVCVDPAMMRTNIGASRLLLDGGANPERVAYGLTVGYGTGLASALIGRRAGLAGQDDLWIDLTTGGRASDPLYYLDWKEGFFAVSMDTGYVLLAGWNAERWGLFAGPGVRYTTTFVGGSSDFENAKAYVPLTVRGQVRAGELLFKGYAWSTLRLRNRGVRVDVPLGSWIWLSGQWQRTGADVSLHSDDNGVFSAKGGSVLTVSVRTSLMD